MTFLFWVVILALTAGAIWGAVHQYRLERNISKAMKELDDEV